MAVTCSIFSTFGGVSGAATSRIVMLATLGQGATVYITCGYLSGARTVTALSSSVVVTLTTLNLILTQILTRTLNLLAGTAGGGGARRSRSHVRGPVLGGPGARCGHQRRRRAALWRRARVPGHQIEGACAGHGVLSSAQTRRDRSHVITVVSVIHGPLHTCLDNPGLSDCSNGSALQDICGQ